MRPLGDHAPAGSLHLLKWEWVQHLGGMSVPFVLRSSPVQSSALLQPGCR